MVMVGSVFYTGPAAKAISQRIHGKTSSEFFFFLQYNGLVFLLHVSHIGLLFDVPDNSP